MARSKQSRRIQSIPLRPRRPLAVMSVSTRHWDLKGKSMPEPSQQNPKRAEVVDLSTEIRALELDVANNPYPASTRS